MEDILREIVTEVSELCPIGFEWVSPDQEFPYVTYSYSSTTHNNQDSIEVTFDIWDKSKSFQQVQDLAKDIREKLQRHKFKTEEEDFFAISYHERQLTIAGDSPDIKRIRTEFSIRKYQI